MSALSNLTSLFSPEARLAWHEFLLTSRNRFRPTVEKMILIRDLLSGARTAGNDNEYRLKYEAKKRYRLEYGALQIRTRRGGVLKTVVADEEAFDVIVRDHIGLSHTGRDKTLAGAGSIYYGITREEIAWVLRQCRICSKTQSQRQRAPVRPIVVSNLSKRVQVDLLDMISQPDGSYRWIFYMRGHFSKYSAAYPITDISSETVAAAIMSWIVHFGPPRILHCDNGAESRAVLLLMRQHGIQVINGRSRHPQSQGLIEQVKGHLEGKIAVWLEDNQSAHWSQALPEAILSMNRLVHSVMKKAPYTILFNQPIKGRRVIPVERPQTEVEDTVIENSQSEPEVIGGATVSPGGIVELYTD